LWLEVQAFSLGITADTFLGSDEQKKIIYDSGIAFLYGTLACQLSAGILIWTSLRLSAIRGLALTLAMPVLCWGICVTMLLILS
jgi:hypothetical protein